jgi:hypothetical protein
LSPTLFDYCDVAASYSLTPKGVDGGLPRLSNSDDFSTPPVAGDVRWSELLDDVEAALGLLRPLIRPPKG